METAHDDLSQEVEPSNKPLQPPSGGEAELVRNDRERPSRLSGKALDGQGTCDN